MTPARFSLALLFVTLIQPASFGQMVGSFGTSGFYVPTQIYEPGRSWLGTGQVFLGDIVSGMARPGIPQRYPIPSIDHMEEVSYLPKSSLPSAAAIENYSRPRNNQTFRVLDTGETPEGVLPAGYPSSLMSGGTRKATFIYSEAGRVRLGDVHSVPR